MYWKNHFSTIGIIGMNEACLNFLGRDITTAEGQRFALRVMDFMREAIAGLQEETGTLFNLEATPGEGTSYRLAMLDKKQFPDIISANESRCARAGAPRPYYTNSTQLPGGLHRRPVRDPEAAGRAADQVHRRHGPARLSGRAGQGHRRHHGSWCARSPPTTGCPISPSPRPSASARTHGYLDGEQPCCSRCSETTEVYSRVVGYLRPVEQWNNGKQAEFGDRKNLKIAS